MLLSNYRLYIKALLVLGVISCGKNSETNSIKQAWDFENAPERLGLKSNSYQRNFDILKKNSRLRKKPWSGDYWASYLGGVSYRWNHPRTEDKFRVFYKLKPMSRITTEEIPYLSPSEKMDLINFDESYSFTHEERYRTEVMDRRFGHKIPEWFGLCHAWAPATYLFKNPSPIVYKRSDGLEIPLGSSDIKAMLTYFVHETYSKSYFVSRRCDVDDAKLKRRVERGEISLDEYTSIMESANCRGVNPGAFHILLANMIGIRNKSFILDITRDVEVWNQAIYSYRSKVLETRESNFSPEADPRTRKEVKVRTVMSHISEIEPTWHKDTTTDSLDYITYDYWLELDEMNNIIGGTWISDERPDFLWTQERPRFNQRFKFLRDIYRQSIGRSFPRSAPASRGPRNTPTEENTEEVSDSIQISVHMTKRIPSIFGERVEIKGISNTKVKRLRIDYYSQENKMIKTRWIHVRPNNRFNTASFFWGQIVKVKEARIIVLNKHGETIKSVLVPIN